jgi:hypothetical protein
MVRSPDRSGKGACPCRGTAGIFRGMVGRPSGFGRASRFAGGGRLAVDVTCPVEFSRADRGEERGRRLKHV